MNPQPMKKDQPLNRNEIRKGRRRLRNACKQNHFLHALKTRNHQEQENETYQLFPPN